MSKVKTLAKGTALAVAGAAAVYVVKKTKDAYKLELENCTEDTLDIFLGTETAPDAIVFKNFAPKSKERVDLTLLPLCEHDVVYIRFAPKNGQPSYKRTLIYDVDECGNSPMHGMIVDYGEQNYDVKLVKLG